MLLTITESGVNEQIVDNLASYEQLLNSQFDLHLPHTDVAALWQKVWARHQEWVQREHLRLDYWLLLGIADFDCTHLVLGTSL